LLVVGEEVVFLVGEVVGFEGDCQIVVWAGFDCGVDVTFFALVDCGD